MSSASNFARAKDIDVNGRDGVLSNTSARGLDIACDPDIVVLANHHGVHIDATDANFDDLYIERRRRATRWPVAARALGADARAKDTTGQRPRDYSKPGYTFLRVAYGGQAAAVRKKNARRRTMAMAKLKHVSHRGDGASFGGDSTRSYPTIGSTKSAKSHLVGDRKTHFPPASPTRSPSTYRAKDEVARARECAGRGADAAPRPPEGRFLSQSFKSVHLATSNDSDTKEGASRRPVADGAFTNILGRALPAVRRVAAHDRRRAAGTWTRLAKPPKTPVTPPTDTSNIAVLVPPDDMTWRNEHIPEPQSPPKKAKRKRRKKSVDEDTTPPGTSRHERRRDDGQGGRSTAVC